LVQVYEGVWLQDFHPSSRFLHCCSCCTCASKWVSMRLNGMLWPF